MREDFWPTKSGEALTGKMLPVSFPVWSSERTFNLGRVDSASESMPYAIVSVDYPTAIMYYEPEPINGCIGRRFGLDKPAWGFQSRKRVRERQSPLGVVI